MTWSRPLSGAMDVSFVAYELLVDTRTRDESTPRRRLRVSPLSFGLPQAVLVAAGWAVFLWSWVSVVRHTAPSTMLWTLGLLGSCALVNEGIALGWIHHNLRIFARKGPRKAVFVPEHEFAKDFLDRELVADWAKLLDEGAILIDFDDARKTYTPFRGDPTAENLIGPEGQKPPEQDAAA